MTSPSSSSLQLYYRLVLTVAIRWRPTTKEIKIVANCVDTFDKILILHLGQISLCLCRMLSAGLLDGEFFSSDSRPMNAYLYIQGDILSHGLDFGVNIHIFHIHVFKTVAL